MRTRFANLLLNSKKKFDLLGFDLKQSNIEDIGIAFENRFKSRNIFKGWKLNIIIHWLIGKSGKLKYHKLIMT